MRDARSNNVSCTTRGRKVLALVASFFMVMSLLILPAPAGAEDSTESDDTSTTSGPAISKTLDLNKDKPGYATLNLSVTGSAKSNTTQTKANVIFVADVSGSMNDATNFSIISNFNNNDRFGDDGNVYGLVDGKYRRLYYDDGDSYPYYYDNNGAHWYTRGQFYRGTGSRLSSQKDVLNSAAKTILDQGNTQVGIVTFSDNVKNTLSPTSNANIVSAVINDMSATGGTNWEAGLSQAQTLLSNDSQTKNYIIFVSDGNPTFRSSANGYWDDFYASLGVYGTGNSDPNNRNYNAANSVATSLISSGVELYKVNAFGDADNMKSLGGNDSSKYFFEATSSDDLSNALSQIVQSITNAHSYTNVSMADTLSGDMVEGTVSGGIDSEQLTYKITDASGKQVNVDGSPSDGENTLPAATVSGKNIIWNLGADYQLKDGYTYTVSFPVKLTQEACNEAAALTNDAAAEHSGNLYRDTDGTIKVYSNTETGNQVTYTELTTVNNKTTSKDGSKPFPRPTMDVPTLGNLTISKTVTGGAANVNQEYSFQLSSDSLKGKTFGQVAFNDAGVANVTVRPGSPLTIAGFPAGTVVSVTETGLKGNAMTSTTAKVDDDDAQTVKTKGSDVEQSDAVSVTVSARPYTIDESGLQAPTDANTVAFTNNTDLAPQVGITMNSLPMVALLVAAGAGVSGLVIAERRRSHEG